MIIRVAQKCDIPSIKSLRKEVFGTEDRGGIDGEYIVAEDAGRIVGFVYVRFGKPYEWQRYIDCVYDENMYEIGRLTVEKTERNAGIAHSLMHASKLWCVSRNWANTFCIFAYPHMIETYKKMGMKETEYTCETGTLMMGDTNCRTFSKYPIHIDIKSTHGGTAFETCDDIPIEQKWISADVLDAWFAAEHNTINSYMVRSSPPTHCKQLIAKIHSERNIPSDRSIVVGAGSSDLIFRSIPLWIEKNHRVLTLKPTYSEYPHVIKNVVGCMNFAEVDELNFECEFKTKTWDWVVIVNPNSPTGNSMDNIEQLVKENPNVNFWIDETYIDLAGKQSVESLCYDNLYVCKSMSKSYGLSGMRVGYIVGPHESSLMYRLKLNTPPWCVSYPSQIMAYKALENHAYYEDKWRKTQEYRKYIISRIEKFCKVNEGTANFYTISLNNPETLCEYMKNKNIYIRQIDNGVRIAVRNEEDNEHIINALEEFFTCFTTRFKNKTHS